MFSTSVRNYEFRKATEITSYFVSFSVLLGSGLGVGVVRDVSVKLYATHVGGRL